LRVKVASVTYFPPRERGVNSPDRKGRRRGSAGRGGRGWLKGGELDGEDVASGTEEGKAA
jgi:hypothetical protein